MGGTQSTPEPAAPPQASSQRDRRQPEMSLDEKFDAVRIDHGGSSSKRSRTFDDDDDRHEHVSVSKTEEYVKELLKDGKNRLGLSTFSTTNPTSVLCVYVVLLKLYTGLISSPMPLGETILDSPDSHFHHCQDITVIPAR